MTVTSATARANYVGTGAIVPYPYPFRIFAATDLSVISRDSVTGIETVLNYPADYAVSGVGNGTGGAVTLVNALASGDTLAIRRVRPVKQQTVLRNQGAYFPAEVENALDSAVMIAQEHEDRLGRSIALSESYDPADYNMTLPAPSPGKALVWDVAGTGLDNAALSAAQLSEWSATQNMELDVFVVTVDFTAGVTTQLTLSDSPGSISNVTIVRRTSGTNVPYMSDQFSVAGAVITFTAAIPASTTRIEVSYLLTFQVNTVNSANVLFGTNFSDTNVDTVQAGTGAVTRTARAKLRERVSVADFGATGDGSDQTVEISAAMAQILAATDVVLESIAGVPDVSTGSRYQLWFPKGRYALSSAVPLGGYVDLDFENAVVEGLDVTKDLFTSSTAIHWRVRGGMFVGGRHQFNLGNTNTDQSLFEFDTCQFHLSQDYAIKTQVYGGVYTHLSANLTVRKSLFSRCRKLLDNVCDSALVQDTWAYVDKTNFDANSAAIKNNGPDGRPRLLLDKFFGVPTMGTGGARLAGVRWIDNYNGEVAAVDSRFGGEESGMPIVKHFGAPSTVYPYYQYSIAFDRCWLFCGPTGGTDTGVVVLSEIPGRVSIKDCLGPVAAPFIVDPASVATAGYFSTWEAASTRKAWELFSVDIVNNGVLGPDTGGPRIPTAMRPYLNKARQTKVRCTTTLACAAAYAVNTVTFDTLDFDTVAGWAVASPTHLPVPAGAGRMRLVITAKIAGGGSFAGGDLGLLVYNSSTVVVGAQSQHIAVSAADIYLNLTVDVDGDSSAGEFFTVSIQTTAAGGCSLLECTAVTTPLDFVL